IDLLKFDIEGSEFEVTGSSPDDILRRIGRLVAEVHTEHGRLETLTAKLRQCGFSYVTVKRPLRKRTDDKKIQVIDEDIIKLLMKTVNFMIDMSHYSDWSSMLLFASQDPEDFDRPTLKSLKGAILSSWLDRGDRPSHSID
ncbi:MAG TPA: FkbM family methyltransferase, partial [Candidatus Binatus sp.]|nr:FkbM family methyltransferase [Candidatus Binatus sp.]